jgi:hypothetical protein
MKESALEFRRRVLPPNHPDIALSVYNVSLSYRRAGNILLALDRARQALLVWRSSLPASHPYVKLAEQNVESILLLHNHSTAHAAAALAMTNAGSVIVTRHRGGGFAGPDYMLQFDDFNTFVADMKLCGGSFYFEMQVIEIEGQSLQFGCCCDSFEPREYADGEGAGDDGWSWGVCGLRQEKWHAGSCSEFGSAWCVGDVIGFALDMRTAGDAAMSVSVNGSFASPNGLAFSGIDAPFLSPALSGTGRHRVNFGDRPFAHAPPGPEFASVHEFGQLQRVDGQVEGLLLAGTDGTGSSRPPPAP